MIKGKDINQDKSKDTSQSKNKDILQNIHEAKEYIHSQLQGRKPLAAITLGSGLGSLTDHFEDPISIAYENIPHFHQTTVPGHKGELICGSLEGKTILALKGRIHAYEGHPLQDIVFPTRVISALGIAHLILTNASGGMNPHFKEGDLILISDHLNLTGDNPLKGRNLDELGPRFPDMTTTWAPELREKMHLAAKKMDYPLKEGVYAGVLGPTYETAAEIKMYRLLGGDMVGMSTVPEAIAGHHCGLKIVGISCITNMAAGIHEGKLNHNDIKNIAQKINTPFLCLFKEFLKIL